MKLLVYRKATEIDQYLNFSFNHPIHHKLGAVRTLLEGMKHVVTDDKDLEEKKKMSLPSVVAVIPSGLPCRSKTRWKTYKSRKKKQRLHQEVEGLIVPPFVKGIVKNATRIFAHVT